MGCRAGDFRALLRDLWGGTDVHALKRMSTLLRPMSLRIVFRSGIGDAGFFPMKKLLLFFLLLAAAFGIDARAVEYVTLVVPPGLVEGEFFSEPLVLAAGDSATMLYCGKHSGDTPYPYLEVTIGGTTVDLMTGTDGEFGQNQSPVLAGPATIRAKRYSIAAFPMIVTFAVTRAVTTTNMVPANAVVIPEDAGGQYQVILESSTDLITWTPALPGSYGGSTQKRFFRTRIVKSE